MFSVGSWMKVWKIESKGNYTQTQCSTQQKKDGSYVTDFSGFVRFIGEAHRKAVDLCEKDSIKILKCGVSTAYSNGKNYTNFLVFDFETKEAEMPSNDDDSELPFS